MRQSTATIIHRLFRITSGPRRPDCNSLPDAMANVRRALAARSNDRRQNPDFGVPMNARFKGE